MYAIIKSTGKRYYSCRIHWKLILFCCKHIRRICRRLIFMPYRKSKKLRQLKKNQFCFKTWNSLLGLKIFLKISIDLEFNKIA